MSDIDLERRLDNLEGQVSSFISAYRSTLDSERARQTQQDILNNDLTKWMERIDKQLEEQRDNNKWLLRIVGSAALLAMINFVIQGGLGDVVK